jgi:hypothetical protein
MGEENMMLPYESKGFEELRQVNAHGAEYWSARALQGLQGYGQWRRFADAIRRAQISCEQSASVLGDHFAGAGKMVVLGSGSKLRTVLRRLPRSLLRTYEGSGPRGSILPAESMARLASSSARVLASR